ncbi:MAG: hypothetical protein RPU37_14625, partial [Candidatus Sedimenticola sp. (ex Thyasira tokunagai)]
MSFGSLSRAGVEGTGTTASLRSRETFWDIPVAKINSIFDSLFAPWPPCVRAPSPHHRKLGAGY